MRVAGARQTKVVQGPWTVGGGEWVTKCDLKQGRRYAFLRMQKEHQKAGGAVRNLPGTDRARQRQTGVSVRNK